MTSQNPDPGWQRPEDAPARPASARLVDPEDDVSTGAFPATFGGDAETTKLSEPSPSTGYGVFQQPEPLPYVQPAQQYTPPPSPPASSAAPVEINPVDGDRDKAGRRGTQDLGLLVLRVALGVVFIAHGLQNAFGWWGGPGLQGFKETLKEAGYQNADLLTYLTAGGQLASGVLLVLGLFTPVAAAVALAFLVNSMLATFTSQRADGGLVVFGSVAEYLVILLAAASTIILAGPGRYGFDGGRGWARRPFIGSFLAFVLGAAGGVAAWLFLRGNNPFA